MNIRNILKRAAFLALGSNLAIYKRINYLNRSSGRIILNLHRVAEPDGSAYQPLKPKIFIELLNFISQHFNVTTFQEPSVKTGKPNLILSFDDGYKDFIEIAAPLLQESGLTCNHNIIPGCVESQRPPLNVMAQDFVGKAPRELVEQLEVPGFEMKVSRRLGHRLSAFIKNRSQEEQRALADILLPQFFNWDGFEPTPMMTREDVVQVAAEHELGGHSYSHASMACETLDYVRADVERCKTYFFRKLGQPMNVYAFPNGSGSREQIEIVQASGIKHVLMVGESFDIGTSCHSRFTFFANTTSEAKFKATGRFRSVPL